MMDNLIWMSVLVVNWMSHNGAFKTGTHPTKDRIKTRSKGL